MDHSTPHRFTLGTLLTYPAGGKLEGEIWPAVQDEKHGSVYAFLSWEGAHTGIDEMRRDPDAHPYAPTRTPGAFEPAAPGVDRGIAS
jgi:hypothetical protein